MNAQHAIHVLRDAGWSDAAIAHQIGCSQPTITRIRNGKTDPRESIARALEKLSASAVAEARQQRQRRRDQENERKREIQRLIDQHDTSQRQDAA